MMFVIITLCIRKVHVHVFQYIEVGDEFTNTEKKGFCLKYVEWHVKQHPLKVNVKVN